MSFWGNYLPRVYPTHLRGTGEGFAANIGGRMLGTGFAFVTTTLTNYAPGATPPLRLAFAATVVATFVYTAGLICSFFLPEPKGEDLPGIRCTCDGAYGACSRRLRRCSRSALAARLSEIGAGQQPALSSRRMAAVPRTRIDGRRAKARIFPRRGAPPQNVTWKTAIPGHGWSSPIAWGDRIFVTSVIPVGDRSKRRRSGLYFGGERPAPTGRTPLDGLRHRLEHREDRCGSARRIAAFRRHRGT